MTIREWILTAENTRKLFGSFFIQVYDADDGYVSIYSNVDMFGIEFDSREDAVIWVYSSEGKAEAKKES